MKRLKVDGLFFDLDGTIVDSQEAYIEAAKIAFRTMGQKIPEKNAALEIPRKLERKQPINDIIKGDLHEFLGIYLKAYYSLAEEKTKPFPNISSTLEKLSAKAKLALVTMRTVPREKIKKELEKFNIAKYFTYVVTALDTNKPKPSPEALLKCGSVLNVQMCNSIIVGDSISDVRAGKAAGSKTVAVLSGLFSYQELLRENPDLIIKDITSLPSVIK